MSRCLLGFRLLLAFLVVPGGRQDSGSLRREENRNVPESENITPGRAPSLRNYKYFISPLLSCLVSPEMKLSTGARVMDTLAGLCIDELIDCWLFFFHPRKKTRSLDKLFHCCGCVGAAAGGDGKRGLGQVRPVRRSCQLDLQR